MSSSDDEIDAIVEEVHSGNSARASNAKLLIASSVVLGLKSIFLNSKTELCVMLFQAQLFSDQLSSMRKFRRRALIDQSLRKEMPLPDMKVPKLTAQAFDDGNTSFTSVVGLQHSLAGISLDYWLRDEEFGNYEANWPSREEKLRF